METAMGGYKSLPFFKQAEIIYDFTVEFVKRYIDYKSRTKDQMEQVFDSEGRALRLRLEEPPARANKIFPKDIYKRAWKEE